ncbi:MAG: hypothetical protein ACREID_05110 [Planctomycetota bacterium]
MTKAIDPFEEYLRKKKVEMLARKVRESLPGAKKPAADEPVDAKDADADARLQEEMREFFDAGHDAAAQLFSRVGRSIPEEKVEEIREALEEVLEEEPPAPRAETGETFVNFFRQISEEYRTEDEAREAEAQQLELVEEPEPEAPPVSRDVAREIAASAAPDDAAAARGVRRLDLAEILSGAPVDEAQSRQRLDLLCRLVAKLVERAGIGESEIIEALIKSGVHF